MDNADEIKNLKTNIIELGLPDKQRLVDRLIELEGMNSMSFFQSVFLIDPYHQKESSVELHNIAGYGVRRLMKLQAMQGISEFKFCPCCKSDLAGYKLTDFFVTGLRCGNSHFFHIDIEQPRSNDINIKSEKNVPLEIAKDWLTDKDLRNNLQNQLAEILRKYIDIKSSPGLAEQTNDLFEFCPICSAELKKFEQDDVWVEGLKCLNDHVFYSRNGLNYKGTQLAPDLSAKSFKFLLDAYLDDPNDYVPAQILKLLGDIQQEVQSVK